MAAISLVDVVRRFPGGVAAVDRCSLVVNEGEYLVILGPSGCGKTTLLRLIAGLDHPQAGSITMAGRNIAALRPHQRDIGMVFQNSALYPHMSIRRNLAFPLRTRGMGRDEIAHRIESISAALRIDAFLDRKPGELSGGEQQRAALGRALVIQPRAILLDEPLSDLDAHLRDELRRELSRIHTQFKPTVIHVTHDQDEAVELGDRVAVMAGGRVQQVGSAAELMNEPTNRFVAGFLGRPPMNFLRGVLRWVEAGDSRLELERADASPIALPTDGRAVPEAAIGREVAIGVRPGDMRIAEPDEPHITLTVAAIHRRLEANFITAALPESGELVLRWLADRGVPQPGDRIPVRWADGAMYFFKPGLFGAAVA